MSAAYATPAAQANALHAAAGLRVRLPDSDHLLISGTEHGEIDITVVRGRRDTDEDMYAVIDRISGLLMVRPYEPRIERIRGDRAYAVHGQYVGVPVRAAGPLNGSTS